MISTVGLKAASLTSQALSGRLKRSALRLYGRNAAAVLRREGKGARVYHYRAGFGQSSVKVARDAGMRTICDHSLVHPSLLQSLVENGGRYPDRPPTLPHRHDIWNLVLEDIEQADLVLVNSDFVAQTFAFMGFDASRLRVVYQGVDDKFLSRLPNARDYYVAGCDRPLRLLFAGGIGPRKGVDEIAAALESLKGARLELHLAGTLNAEARTRYAGLLADPRVTYHGMLSQDALAELMSRSDLFLFPSRAEGSARVLFEAMAAGCAVITTTNAGSVLRDGEGGQLVPVSDQAALVEALETALEKPERCATLGSANREITLDKYRQCNYGNALEEIYDESLSPAKKKSNTE